MLIIDFESLEAKGIPTKPSLEKMALFLLRPDSAQGYRLTGKALFQLDLA